MTIALWRDIHFAYGVASRAQFPPERGGEVAFAGRSNAGKSSALNALAARKRLAHVSKMPGRTRQINFFGVSGGRYLVDLPGYGHAATAAAARAGWNALIGDYLLERASLRGVVLVMDIRRPLTELDIAFIEWFAPTGKPLHVLLSKADRMSRSAALATLRRAADQLARLYPHAGIQLFSSTRKIGIVDAATEIARWLEASGRK